MAGPRPCADRLRSDQGSALVIVLTLVAMIMMLVLAVLETGAASTRRSRLTATNSEADALEQIRAELPGTPVAIANSIVVRTLSHRISVQPTASRRAKAATSMG